jgi:hypothetical protein
MVLSEFLINQGSKLFSDRQTLLLLWQHIAENFYPERADFLIQRTIGSDFAGDLATGQPVLMRRELANAIGGMLRPTNKVWAHARVGQWDEVPLDAKQWLERAEERQRRAMYNRNTGFSRATKEADNDFAAFGQAVLQITTNPAADNLLYRCWHLRDCAWGEDETGAIGMFFRKWKTTVIDLMRVFGEQRVHPRMHEMRRQNPMAQVEIWHCAFKSDFYDQGFEDRFGAEQPYRSVYLDIANKHVIESVGVPYIDYVVARWQTVSGSQYAYSPAVVAGLPDARTLQEMTITLLEAGEKAVTPPLLGVQGALRSDVNVMAGGITWVDREYDERLGEVLRPMTVDKNGIPLGRDMAQDVIGQLREAFYLDTLNMPPTGGPDMTAYEFGQRVQEFIRRSLPLFEPLESDYNAPTCEITFDLLMRHGVFGPITEMPESLQGREVIFMFESPLHDAVERLKAQRYLETVSLISTSAGLTPESVHILDNMKATREALLNQGAPADWLRPEQEVDQIVRQIQEAAQQQAMLEQMQQGAEVAKTIGTTPVPSGTGGSGPPLT